MEPDYASDPKNPEVSEITVARPLSEVGVSELAEVEPGRAVIVDSRTREGFPTLSCDPSPVDAADSTDRADFHPPDDVPPHRNGQLQSVIECMLFVSPEPLSCKQIADTLDLEETRVQEALDKLDQTLGLFGGLQLMRVAGGFQLCTRPEYADYCSMILQPSKRKLSKAALETLAVVAYRQPCTMPEIEAVRGVSVDGVIHTLMDRGLVREAGRKKTPGRPILYATTQEFLEYFGLNDVSELPDIDMLAVEEVKALQSQRELLQEQ